MLLYQHNTCNFEASLKRKRFVRLCDRKKRPEDELEAHYLASFSRQFLLRHACIVHKLSIHVHKLLKTNL